MKIKAILTIFLCYFAAFSGNSSNLPFKRTIENFSSDIYGGNRRVWDITSNNKGFTFAAASSQLCIFDGMEWNSYQAGACLRSLFFDEETQRLYAAGDNFFGYWEEDEYGKTTYRALYQNKDNLHYQVYWKIIPYGHWLYVATHEAIYLYNIDEHDFEATIVTGDVGYIFKSNECILGQVDGELYFISGDQMKTTGLKSLDRIVAVKFDDEGLLYVTEHDGINRFHNGISTEVFPELNKELNSARVFSAKIKDDGSLILGTIQGGAYIVDAKGNVVENFNDNNGMSSSSVLSLAETGKNDYWFGLDGGISHADLNSPEMYYFSKDQKIGDVFSVAIWNDELYLGTNKGLYRIDNDGKSHLVPHINGTVWKLIDCDGFLAIQVETELSLLYPDGRCLTGVSDAWELKKWEGDLFYCSDSDGIIVLEKKDGKLVVRNRLENYDGHIRVSPKHDGVGNIWVDFQLGAVQRLRIDADKRTVLKTTEYKVGDPNTIVYSHFVDNTLVFTQGADSYIYDPNTDKVVYSEYYSKMSHSFGTEIYSFLQYGDHFFNFSDNRSGIVQRVVDEYVYSSNIFSSYSKDLFSENNSTFCELNDSLITLNAANGIVAYNIKNNKSRIYPPLELNQCHYDVTGETKFCRLNKDLEFPHNATGITLSLSGLSRDRNVYYAIDNNDKVLIRDHSSIELPYISRGKHSITFSDSAGNTLYSVGLKIQLHWILSWWFILLAILFITGVTMLAIAYSRHRAKLLKLKYTQREAEHMEQERMKFENEKLSMELRERNAKLTSLAIHDININNILKEIESEINNVASQSKEMSDALRPIKKVVDRCFRNNGSWKSFESYFNGVYDGFFDRLRAKYPQLTQNDLKICSYIRLGMTTKEISSLMNIEVVSVESARYRLRKNMGLSPDDSLTEIISKI